MRMNIAECKQKWPILFQEYLRGREIDFEQGWDELVSELNNKLEEINKSRSEEQGFVRCYQSKEKFGVLAYYESCPEDIYRQVQELIREAELKADQTCELCGQPGIIHRRGAWLRTVCKQHAEEMGFEKIVEKGEE
jgi:ribosomal protein S14